MPKIPEDLLQSVVDDPTGLIPEELVDPLGKAWAEVQPLFEPARQVVRVLPESLLGPAGLSGAQLDLKTASVRLFAQRFWNLREQGREFLGAAAGAFAVACRVIDEVLKSVPIPQLHESITEFKSIVEKCATAVAFVTGA